MCFKIDIDITQGFNVFQFWNILTEFMFHSLNFCLKNYNSLYQPIETDVMSVTVVQYRAENILGSSLFH